MLQYILEWIISTFQAFWLPLLCIDFNISVIIKNNDKKPRQMKYITNTCILSSLSCMYIYIRFLYVLVIQESVYKTKHNTEHNTMLYLYRTAYTTTISWLLQLEPKSQVSSLSFHSLWSQLIYIRYRDVSSTSLPTSSSNLLDLVLLHHKKSEFTQIIQVWDSESWAVLESRKILS